MTVALLKSQILHMSIEKQETLLKLAILTVAAILCKLNLKMSKAMVDKILSFCSILNKIVFCTTV
jgi:hypothetical protein